MADKFRVALSGDFKKADGSPTFPDFDVAPLQNAPGVEVAYLDAANPIRSDQIARAREHPSQRAAVGGRTLRRRL
jgi:hypothetical protein